MLTIAYLANQFPCPVEPYVSEEIEELRRRGVRVITGSVRRAPKNEEAKSTGELVPEVVLQSLGFHILVRAAWLFLRKWPQISGLLSRVMFRGREGLVPRLKAVLHTWLGACYAVLLGDYQVEHIHVHHGYFGSWIAMVAARLSGVGYSMTLHGSDLLLHAAYLDAKLENCAFCLTVSEYNKQYVLEHYPHVNPERVVVSRLGVEVADRINTSAPLRKTEGKFSLLAVGRLHPVKDHAFLVRACAQLQANNLNFECLIAGDGPEKRHLELLIQQGGLDERITLLGHVPRQQMDSLYDRSDVVVLTSRSEGIPLVLMEAMARGKVVLAPSITGIPELVIAGKTGFLYQPGSLDDFVHRLLFIRSLIHISGRDSFYPDPIHAKSIPATCQLDWVRHAARAQVRHNFNRKKNLETFGDLFLSRVTPRSESLPHENFILQQI
jgi:colanic acid/amylovoran biosynthesis glycosyltransferase